MYVALPDWATANEMCRRMGFEPITHGLQGKMNIAVWILKW